MDGATHVVWRDAKRRARTMAMALVSLQHGVMVRFSAGEIDGIAKSGGLRGPTEDFVC